MIKIKIKIIKLYNMDQEPDINNIIGVQFGIIGEYYSE